MIMYLPINRGITLAPWLILIPAWAKASESYLAHEQCHAEQMRRVGTLIYGWRYLTDQPFRLAAEVEAYKAQIKAGATVLYCASELAHGYRIGMPLDDAIKLLTT